ncbi:MAG: hypothetical protein KDA76_02210 [Planctomycetaceae bacterium]|nr:hypothetical protein [Planctomycetaceae bacterium]
MIHSLARMLFGVAVIAGCCVSVASAWADSPTEVVQAAGEQTASPAIQQVAHDVCTEHCKDKCCKSGDVCYVDGYCDRCRRLGLFGRMRAFCGYRCENEHCRNCRGGLGSRFLPNGCGGKGCPPFGAYQMVYPLNPDHFDLRDGQVHAAQGYGVPMAVPLAPVVRQQYNYSWGVPASRITHISNHAPHYLQGGHGYGYPGYMGPGYPPGYCPQCQAGQGH